MQICDSVTILKDGSYVDTMPIENVTKDSLIQMMVGRPATDIYNIRHFDTDEELLRVENFSDSKHFKNINFTLHKGEILGFAGLVGAGRSEVMRALTAVEKRLSGDVYLKGKKVHLSNPTDALKHGIGFLTEDRRTDGCALKLDIKTNVNMSSYDMISKAGCLNLRKEKKRAEEFSRSVMSKRRLFRSSSAISPAATSRRSLSPSSLPRSRNPDL